jgi:mannonate dehydratase
MNRRDFLLTSGAASAAAILRAAPLPDAMPSASVPPASMPSAGRMKVGCQRWGSDPKHLGFLLRFGVRNICASPARSGPDGVWSVESLRDATKAVEDAGLHVDAMYWNVTTDVLIPDRRDAAIDRNRRQIEAAGKAGIPLLLYNLHVRTWRARTAPTTGRGGSTYGAWDLAQAELQKGKPNIGPIDADEMWARITYFLQKVVPVATESKVWLGCHPPDPPVPADNSWKIAQVLDTVEGLKKFVSICPSDYHGLNFCQGTIAEMLRQPAADIFDAIRWFGQRRKIFNVHFRNIRGRRDKFEETYHDEGDIDMAKAVLAYKDVGYEGLLMPDHVPHHGDDPDELQHFAWAYGYIAGLIQGAYAIPAGR